MLLEKISKEDLIQMFKSQLLKCNKSISINKTKPYELTANFTKEYVYRVSRCEGGSFVQDDNDKWIDINELADIGQVDVEKVFVGL